MDGYYVLTVKDNGLGIKKEHLDKVFLMFKRFHSHVQGTGIGLYMVKRIIENAKGKIVLESELGEGSTFKIFLKA
jgi:signal transduction histidine kinase